MQVENLWSNWPVAGPWQLTPITRGANNHVWRATCTDGQAYILRLTPNQPLRLRYETALLEALAAQQLPFRLSIPLKTHQGEIAVANADETGRQVFASLYPLLPGKPPEYSDLVSTPWAATALARLDHALAALPDVQLPEGLQPLPTFGELTGQHASVADPIAAIHHLPIAPDQIEQISRFLRGVQEQVPELYRRLPQQLLHRDYDPSNILIDDRQVTAVLDFEFAGKDLRTMDLCVALSWWPLDLFGTGQEWEFINAFGKTYQTHFPLSEEELRALPALWRLRDAASLIHRIGRYLAGMETAARIQDRIQHSLWREAWITANDETLSRHALSWTA